MSIEFLMKNVTKGSLNYALRFRRPTAFRIIITNAVYKIWTYTNNMIKRHRWTLSIWSMYCYEAMSCCKSRLARYPCYIVLNPIHRIRVRPLRCERTSVKEAFSLGCHVSLGIVIYVKYKRQARPQLHSFTKLYVLLYKHTVYIQYDSRERTHDKDPKNVVSL